MAKRTDIKSILIIGAGPIVIGQACEFDYSGSQACRALMSEGYSVILVNSNPATIMTDPELADCTYVEPLTVESLEAIIAKERPDAILPTMGGQTALNLAFQLHESGVLGQYGVELIGANFNAIRIAENRQAFKEMVMASNLDILRSETVSSVDEAVRVADDLGFPLIIRPAFTLGGSGGSVVPSAEELTSLVESGLRESPINQVLLEESALGWKEYEFEVMRDSRDNVVIVCSVENVDPMGIHTGDSITVAPAQTLSDKEYQTLRNASIEIIRAVGVDAGGCNIQFAVHPRTGRIVVIEMNPRVSRSSALVSKATGVPIAKIAAKLAVGMTLNEIPNDITENTPACFEPAIDYVVTKIPRFNFEKFPGANQELSPQMKSVGEVMAIGRTFQESFQKALRGLEVGLDGFDFPLARISSLDLLEKLSKPSADRIRWIHQALLDGYAIEELYSLTGIDPWFLENFAEILRTKRRLGLYSVTQLTEPLLRLAKSQGFSDSQIARTLASGPTPVWMLTDKRKQLEVGPVYKSVDTCAGEFEAYTPYYYSTYDGSENEAVTPSSDTPNRRVVILGGGPNRIGQGIEFDYCCVHAAFTLKQMGYEAIMVNSNPETVSTDYDISHRLYFEPLTVEDVQMILKQEKPLGVIAQLGGQTPLKLSQPLHAMGYPMLGTSAESIDIAEDRGKFRQMVAAMGLRTPESGVAKTYMDAIAVGRSIGFPLIVRPSYVLGGQAMRIIYDMPTFKTVLTEMFGIKPDHPVLIERFLENAQEVDVDAVSDGESVFIAGILEHIEHAGIHSGDSVCVWPAQTLSDSLLGDIRQNTELLAQELKVKGLLNIQFAIQDGQLYVLEVNPRASRTVPFVAKASGMPLIQMAVRIMLGETLAQVMPAVLPTTNHVAVKVPVFPFNKFHESDPRLGPEMRSTGEVMGIAEAFPEAYAKAILGAGHKLPTSGQVFISVADRDKARVVEVARAYLNLGFSLMATEGTAALLQREGLSVRVVRKKIEGSPNAEDMIREGLIHLVINTPVGEEALRVDSAIRKAAVIYNVPMAATIDGALAMAKAIQSQHETVTRVSSLQSLYSCGNLSAFS